MQKTARENLALLHQVANLQRVELEKRELEKDKQMHLSNVALWNKYIIIKVMQIEILIELNKSI
jgi:hypothetical protein